VENGQLELTSFLVTAARRIGGAVIIVLVGR
jgi:hypothetical protein